MDEHYEPPVQTQEKTSVTINERKTQHSPTLIIQRIVF